MQLKFDTNTNFAFNRPKRVAAIHDLSCFGRCSLAVIMPVLSSMQIQVCPIPTAILSTHFGGLGKPVIHDFTDFIPLTLEHYKTLALDFECIYSGYLNSVEQIDFCVEYIQTYSNALIVVDPVMGDHGKPYGACSKEMQNRMHHLVSYANLITPNLTEAYLLLNKPYNNAPISQDDAKEMLLALSNLAPNYVVITGVPMENGTYANIGYDRKNNAFWLVPIHLVPVAYPGTGDIFASVLTGSFLNGDSLPIAMQRATQFIELAIQITFDCGTDTRYGVMFEHALPYLLHKETMQQSYQPF